MSMSSETANVAPPKATRPFYWSVRRELWEYRSAYLAPLIVAGVVLFGYLIRLAHLPQVVRDVASRPALEQLAQMDKPYGFAAVSIIFAGLIISVFYCLGALNNERRDRSILFWKSLPVSDLTTVLSKASIPLVIVPGVVFAITVVVQLIMLLLGSAVLSANGLSPATLWTHWPPIKMTLVLLYGIVAITLWYAPIFGWLLLVSAWSKRMAFLWASLPLLGVIIVEKIGFDTSHVASLLGYRIAGVFEEGFAFDRPGNGVFDPLGQLTPLRFFSTPGLWLGLAVAAAFLAGAVWLRRHREPI
jgi:ABC-2 type transport system permease protein